MTGVGVALPSEPLWGPDGLVPAIAQDAADGRILMLAWMDAEALATTLETGIVHFHSRSRDRLWRKGETSGHELRLLDLALDCDADARPPGSYTTSLLDGGVDAAARKVTEEATEVLIAAKDDAAAGASGADQTATREALAGETADLVYHALVLLAERGVAPSAVVDVLRGRHRG